MSDEERACNLLAAIDGDIPHTVKRDIIAAVLRTTRNDARDEEREACCKDICEMCRDGESVSFAFMPVGRERKQIATHYVGTDKPWTICKAAAIRERVNKEQ